MKKTIFILFCVLILIVLGFVVFMYWQNIQRTFFPPNEKQEVKEGAITPFQDGERQKIIESLTGPEVQSESDPKVLKSLSGTGQSSSTKTEAEQKAIINSLTN